MLENTDKERNVARKAQCEVLVFVVCMYLRIQPFHLAPCRKRGETLSKPPYTHASLYAKMYVCDFFFSIVLIFIRNI